jgi:hypothetical protein
MKTQYNKITNSIYKFFYFSFFRRKYFDDNNNNKNNNKKKKKIINIKKNNKLYIQIYLKKKYYLLITNDVTKVKSIIQFVIRFIWSSWSNTSITSFRFNLFHYILNRAINF